VLIHFKDGSSRDGVIVGLTGGSMRVAMAGLEDISEFNLMNGQWISLDRCEIVTFEFPPELAQHERFKAAVTAAIRPIRRLPGYLEADDWAPQKVN
jgi:hypothetical protein